MRFVYNDGGRAEAGYKGDAGDCVVRAIAIATDKHYRQVYEELRHRIRLYKMRSRSKKAFNQGNTPRDGVLKEIYRPYIENDLGWKWTQAMAIGSGCWVHLREDELPNGVVIVRLSKHIATVVDGALHDTYDCSREGTRCVYGYWTKENVE